MHLKSLLLGLTMLTLSANAIADNNLPNFSKTQDPIKRQQQFFNYLLPKALHADRAVLQQRKELLALHKQFKAGKKLTPTELSWLKQLYETYMPFDLHNEKAWQQLINRVDVVPVSMILGQADKETAAGTTRFARDGNNLFGTWCYSPGCGLTPKRQPKGEHFEMAKYPTIATSIQRYILNLNTNKAYQSFRQMRAQMRKANKFPSGLTLLDGISHYSPSDKHYISDVRSTIIKFNLASLDNFASKTTYADFKPTVLIQPLFYLKFYNSVDLSVNITYYILMRQLNAYTTNTHPYQII